MTACCKQHHLSLLRNRGWNILEDGDLLDLVDIAKPAVGKNGEGVEALVLRYLEDDTEQLL